MAPERRTQILTLAAVVATLGIVVYLVWPRPSVSASPASNGRGTAGASGAPGSLATRATPGQQVPSVHLPDLEAARPKPSGGKRDLFRDKPPPPPTPAPTPRVTDPTPTVETGPPTPPPPPPIPLKFMGTVGGVGAKIAVLVDPSGHTEHGREGDIVAGRYRILKVGEESVEIAYLDGTGRRTLRVGG